MPYRGHLIFRLSILFLGLVFFFCWVEIIIDITFHSLDPELDLFLIVITLTRWECISAPYLFLLRPYTEDYMVTVGTN